MGTIPVFSDLDYQNTHDPINTASPIGGGGGGVSFDPVEPSRIILKANNNGVNFNYIDPGEKDIILTTASVDPEAGYNAGTGEYTFAEDALVFLQAQVQYDWTSGTSRENGILKIRLDTGGGYNDLYFTDNYGGSSHEKDSFVTFGLYQASTGDKIKATFEATASSNIPIDGDDESTFLSITEVVNSSTDKSPKLLLSVDNNNVDFTHTGGGGSEDIILTNATVDADSGYDNVTGEYTFSEDMSILLIAQVSNDDPNGGGLTGSHSIDVELDTGGGFNVIAIAEDHNGNGHPANNQDSIYIAYAIEASSGDILKLTSRNNKGGVWTYSGKPERTFFQILQLNTPDHENENFNEILLSAHNNGVAITHTAAPGYEDILWSTSPIDPESGYNAGTGEYTLPVGGRFMVISQVRDNESTNALYMETAIEIDTGGGYAIETRYQRFNGELFQGPNVPVWNIFELDAGDIVKISLFADNSGTFFGDSPSSFFQIIRLSAGTGVPIVRERLLQDRTYYIDTTGSDSNDGLTPGNPFLTPQKGIDVASSLDSGVSDVTLQLADGTYTITESIVAKQMGGSGKVIIQGNNVTPSNVVIEITQLDTRALDSSSNSTIYQLKDLKVDINHALANASLINGAVQATKACVEIDNVIVGVTNVGATAVQWFRCQDLGNIFFAGDAEVEAATGSPSQYIYWVCLANGILRCQGRTVTVTGTPAFSVFADCSRGGVIFGDNNTFSGSATGPRFDVREVAFILEGAAGAGFPGNAAGSEDTATSGHIS